MSRIEPAMNRLRQIVVAHPLAAAVLGGSVVAGTVAAGWTVTQSPAATPMPPAATSIPTAAEPSNEVGFLENLEGAGASNVVKVVNQCVDGRLRARASIQLNRIFAPRVAPTNLAEGVSTGKNCRTLAVALQLNLYKRGSPLVAPENAAVAVNIRCDGCITMGWALQYVIPVDDPNSVPRDVDALIREMDAELRAIVAMQEVEDFSEVKARVFSVIARFDALGQHLLQDLDEATSESTPTGQPTPTESPAATPMPTPSPSPTPTATTSP